MSKNGNRKLKRLVRERMATTDESYMTARRAMMSQFQCTCERGNDAQNVTSTVEDCPVHGTRVGGL